MKLFNLEPEYLGELLTRIENSYKVKENGCWEWTKGKFPYGYGKVSVKHKALGAHRIHYQLTKGQVSDDLVIDHLCRNPACINPEHLEAVTQWENNRRGSGISSKNLIKTHCVNGHEFTKENTVIGKNRRACRTCKVAVGKRRDAQRTLEYNARGLNAKGKPLKRIIPYWHDDGREIVVK